MEPYSTLQKKFQKKIVWLLMQQDKKGSMLFLTTGRPLIAIQPFLKTLEMLDFEDFSITFNGGLVQRNTGQILSKKVFHMMKF